MGEGRNRRERKISGIVSEKGCDRGTIYVGGSETLIEELKMIAKVEELVKDLLDARRSPNGYLRVLEGYFISCIHEELEILVTAVEPPTEDSMRKLEKAQSLLELVQAEIERRGMKPRHK
jgi:hypothetical protein